MSPSAPPVLLIDRLCIRYGTATAVAELSLCVRGGEIYGLLGPNGSGKSSTLSAVVGVLAPAGGVIRVQGRTRAEDSHAYLGAIGLVPQELALYEELTVADNLAFFGKLYGLAGRTLRERVERGLAGARLAPQARQRVCTLSGGMQRRLNLACALVHDPTLLLLDEPTAGLDIPSRDLIFAQLRELRDQGRALVFTTHHLEEAELLCGRIGIMDRGRLVAEGTLEQLEAALPAPAHRTVEPEAPRSRLEQVFLELTEGSPVRS
jgi:ABC-2 type transport system ATP-binding protein